MKWGNGINNGYSVDLFKVYINYSNNVVLTMENLKRHVLEALNET